MFQISGTISQNPDQDKRKHNTRRTNIIIPLMSKSTKLEFFFRAVKNHNIIFSKLFVYFFREKLIFWGQEKNGNDMTTFDICFSRKFRSHIPPNERGRISPQLVITLINQNTKCCSVNSLFSKLNTNILYITVEKRH